jgi:hypothetical protein
MSTISYARIFRQAMRGREILRSSDRAIFRYLRIVISIVITLIMLYKFYTDVLSGIL